ncbi:SEC-C domain-containing protein [Halobacillus litoralis]|uniref:SEC-C metal-binding domain-containing protein n=1 Tax=Halobacillus litoralis TaxID=45668 RepID=UPI001CD38CC6|nr:SEC-C metal-binding domain-containing protein [Halobacillus litoralis]MCA0970841.1 SEC-C domain-containing protein [Halobacillus litoralis]
MKVGRNDPCPCGSGKKYKKCCGKKNVIEISDSIVQEELNQLYQRYHDYLLDYYPHLIPSVQSSGNYAELKELMNVAHKTIFTTNDDGRSIMQEFVDRVVRSVKRPLTRESLLEWPHAVPGLFKITAIKSESVAELEEGWSGERYVVTLELDGEPIENEPGYYFGILMKWGQTHQFVPVALSVGEGLYQAFTNYVKDEHHKAESSESVSTFFGQHLDRFIRSFIDFDQDGMAGIGYWDGTPEEKEVLDVLDETIGAEAQQHEEYGLLHTLWREHCKRTNPTIRKPAVFAAALEYFYRESPIVDSPLRPLSQKEIAAKYGVSAGSLSKRFTEVEDTFFEMVELTQDTAPDVNYLTFPSWNVVAERGSYEMQVTLFRHTFETEAELEHILKANQNTAFHPETAEEKAQLFAYDGYEAETLEERRLLAELALTYDPSCIDALVLKASLPQNEEEELYILHEARQIGLRQIEDEDTDELWKNVFARPYMRAQEALAQAYVKREEYLLAIKLYEELLEWNEDDNQGIREQLFPVYIANENWNDATKLLNRYHGENAWFLYSTLLLFSKTSEEIDAPLERMAEEANPYVMDYVKGKRTWDEIPDRYSPGSKEEAIVYAYRNGHLWNES